MLSLFKGYIKKKDYQRRLHSSKILSTKKLKRQYDNQSIIMIQYKTVLGLFYLRELQMCQANNS